MTRRDFFRAGVLGAATVPGALRVASTPVVLKPMVLQGIVTGISARASEFIVKSNAVVTSCVLSVPWRARCILEITGRNAQIIGNHFIREDPPFWARVLRLAP